MKTKSSSYISLPYPFELPLENIKFYKPEKKVIRNFQLKKFVDEKLNHYKPEQFRNLLITGSIADKILNLLDNPQFKLGKLENIKENKKEFAKKINFFVSQNKPILFNVTQIAFKIPNPLKVKSTKPDLGELAFLSEMNDIVEIIRSIYKPGAQIIIFGESYVFNKVVGISLKEADIYFKTIKGWIKKLGWEKNIALYDLSKLSKQHKLLDDEYKKNLASIRQGIKNKDPKILEEIEAVYNTMYQSINMRKYSRKKLMEIYNPNNLSNKHIKQDIKKKTLKHIDHYIAFHSAIRTSKLADTLFPNSLKLSFTQGKNKICLNVINNKNDLYPYHGTAILDNKGDVLVKYEIDVLRKKNVVAHYIKKEKNPFYYTFKE